MVEVALFGLISCTWGCISHVLIRISSSGTMQKTRRLSNVQGIFGRLQEKGRTGSVCANLVSHMEWVLTESMGTRGIPVESMAIYRFRGGTPGGHDGVHEIAWAPMTPMSTHMSTHGIHGHACNFMDTH
jgi:hypothetical protein